MDKWFVAVWAIALQWGRVMRDAEISLGLPSAPGLASLQWGRVMRDAEIRKRGVNGVEAGKLQWGRVMRDAEIGYCHDLPCRDR